MNAPEATAPRTPARLEADQAVRDERFRLLVQGVKDYAIFMLDPEGRVICWNAGAEIVFGHPEAEVMNRDYSLFFTAEAVEADEPGRELRTAAGAAGRFGGERVRVRRGGSPFLAEVVITAVRRDGDGTLLGFSQVTHDVTERRRQEERARQSQKLEAVGALAAGVAHDFNNLLTAIIGYSDVVLDRLPQDDGNREAVEQIAKAGGRAAALTRELMAFCRKQVLAPRVLSLNATLAGLDPMLRRLAGEGVEVVMGLGPDVRNTEMDPVQIEQVIVNLVVNARDAMPDGGRLDIRTANAEADRGPPPEEGGRGPSVVLEVADTGAGMDPATLARIFEPFFTTKGPGKGTGLGLANVYGIVHQSGGRIDVESRPGAGATFRVYLTGSDGPVDAGERPPPSRRGSGGCETVLMVDDEETIRRLGAVVLRGGGYELLMAADGQEAVDIGTRHPGEIHLLLTDVVMPGMGGSEVAERLAITRPGLKVLFMSGYSEDAVSRRGASPTRLAFLEKPFTAKALAAKVREVLDE